MIRKNTLARAGLAAALALTMTTAQAQDIHFTQFNAAPMVINPAFTGAFSGQYRVAGIYRNQWQSVTIPFVTYAASFDAPIVHDLSVDDYLAAGIQLYNDRAGDGNLSNFSGLVSVAYHKFLGSNADKALTVGLQGGYTQKSVDLSKLYFGDEFVNGVFQSGTSQEYPYLNNKINYFTVNAGISWAQSVTENFGYTVGVSGMNLNQPQESFQKRRNSEVGLGMRYSAQAGAIAYLTDKFSVRPGVLYQTQATATELIAGNEFHLMVGDAEVRSVATGVFAGLWYRTGDAFMVSAGLEWKGFRFGASYDYNTSSLKNASGGNGGFELSVRYIAPSPLDFARRLVYPCSRF
ncbi:MAG: type IX secretion system membrane protein PorP/SprF [Sphingobacteriales bacterium]|nr:MAG: type IX secretion system membrane protein PorP/SprF [Sphingobacteriales bacterium]